MKEDTQRLPFITTLEEEASRADQVKDINEAVRGWKAQSLTRRRL